MQADRIVQVEGEIRNLYWHIRNSSRERQHAYQMRYYRRIRKLKAELLALGRTQRQVLDLLACCRRRICRSGCPACGKTVDWRTWS